VRRFSTEQRRWAAIVLLVAIVLAGGALRFQAAARHRATLSADEIAYSHLADHLLAQHQWGSPHQTDPFRWAPGTPVLFAAAGLLGGAHSVGGEAGLGPARVAQALVSTATILAVWGLALVLAGWGAGLVAAAAMAFYPPAIHDAASLLSEPLGALVLVCGLLALALAVRRDERLSPGGGGDTFDRRRTLAAYGGAGAVLALSCLARADMLAAALLIPLVVLVGRRRLGWRAAGLRAGTMLGCTLLVLAPWVIYATSRTHHLVPVTDGTEDTVFIATYLPGNGELHYTFLAFKAAACKRFHSPSACNNDPLTVPPAAEVFTIVAAQHPGLGRSAAISAAVHDNLHKYLLGEPLKYAGMLARHFWRLWGGYFLGALGYKQTAGTLWLHRLLVLLATIGLLAGLWRTRDLTLVAATVALVLVTLLNTVYVAEARDNERMIPLLLAVGAAGWFLALRRPSPDGARHDVPAHI
jgi:4-amino-4-deoxy-L-arabinose transferase-like glycosyltransferase